MTEDLFASPPPAATCGACAHASEVRSQHATPLGFVRCALQAAHSWFPPAAACSIGRFRPA